ncbi:hypothetical protein BWQ96_02340 [Gracilariopsis chorda]|uniref:Uncharacterized protein n=1 Tax=Gracilariopsis chorda TaxID=448386 RepID=A0A2V3J0P5_9FLOR|nr:hypothetical protein BWQ96_02340 [Gracilariopsis chorda]|eukprot:PXF47954.1 hypothetical protein BWQ96_02340 [Gracilariopsis chorda]
MAYALGLGLQVHFSFAENEKASELIDDSCFRAYRIAKCRKQNGKTECRSIVLETQAKRIGTLLDKHGYRDDPDAPFVKSSSIFPSSSNISQIIRVGFHFFQREIDYLSSMNAHERPIILDTVGHSIYMRDMRAVLLEDVSRSSLYVLYSFFGGSKVSSGGVSDAHSDVPIRCPDGWKYVQRITPVDDVYEYCYSLQCFSLDHTVMVFMVQKESCCDKCNYFRCAAATDEVVGSKEVTDGQPKHTISDSEVSPLTSTSDESNHPATLINI